LIVPQAAIPWSEMIAFPAMSGSNASRTIAAPSRSKPFVPVNPDCVLS
jgi:hypothetical protein